MPRTRTVAIMLDLEWSYRRHVDVFVGLQRYAAEQPHWDCVIDEYAADRLKERGGPRYDGIIARSTKELARAARRAKVPVVNVWRNSPVRDLPGVYPDFEQIGRQAAEHLLERGFRRFGCLSAPVDRVHTAIRDAFHHAIADFGCSCDCAHIASQYTSTRDTYQAYVETLDAWAARWQPPVGLLVIPSDVSGRNVVGTARRHGLRVPEDVGVVAGLNETAICLAPPPTLSSIEPSYQKIGYEAARLLDSLMKSKRAAEENPEVLISPGGVIGRQSTDFFAVEDATVADALRFISREAGRQISVDDIAAHVHVGRRTLERRFRSAVGHSVAHEVRRLRIERAKRELIDSDASLKVIAARCGFLNSKRMHEVFARDVQVSPSQFRQEHRVS